MPHRNSILAPLEHYHIFNRGVRKENIFLEKDDYLRFLFLTLHLQASASFRNVDRFVDFYKRNGNFTDSSTSQEIINDREVDLCAFTIMPNHFHMLVHERKEGGTSSYLKRIQGAYALYFNRKYEKSGYVFQGRFKAVHVTSNRQLLYASAYIHMNPRELPQWKNKEDTYPWSSYQDIVHINRWGELLNHSVYSEQFNIGKEYKKYTATSGAKKYQEDYLDEEHPAHATKK